jgi:putative acetyltransferase
MCIPRANEIYQMYVAPAARGTGTAAALIAAGEDHIRAAGFATARLDVIPQNHRAIAFYEKCGWQQGSIETVMLDTLADPFPLECLVMTKNLKKAD